MCTEWRRSRTERSKETWISSLNSRMLLSHFTCQPSTWWIIIFVNIIITTTAAKQQNNIYWQLLCVQLSSVQSFSSVRLFPTPWIAARQASLSITNSWSLLKLMSIESVMPSSHLILCRPLSSHPQSLPASGSFPMSQLFAWGGQSTGVSALASFLPKKSQGWSPSEWTGWISLQSKGLSRVFSNTTLQKHQFFGAQPSSQSNSHIHTWPLEKP